MITSTTCSYKWDKGGFGSYVALCHLSTRFAFSNTYMFMLCFYRTCSLWRMHQEQLKVVAQGCFGIETGAARDQTPNLPTCFPPWATTAAVSPNAAGQHFKMLILPHRRETKTCLSSSDVQTSPDVWMAHFPSWLMQTKNSLSPFLWLLSPLTHPLWLCLKGSCSPLKELFRG